jgi:hypothetical protein
MNAADVIEGAELSVLTLGTPKNKTETFAQPAKKCLFNALPNIGK